MVIFAQRTDTIYHRLFSGLQQAPTASERVRNIGQSGHMMLLLLRNAPNKTCTAPQTIDAGLEASFDGQVWVPAGTQATVANADINGNIVASVTAQGAYPYVRAHVRAFDTTNCRLDAWYSGTVGSQAVVQIAEGQTQQLLPNYRAAPAIKVLVELEDLTCVDLLNINFPGRLDWLHASGTANSGSRVIRLYLKTDEADPILWAPIWQGTSPQLSELFDYLVPFAHNWHNQFQMYVCAEPQCTGCTGSISFTIGYSYAP